MSLTEPKHYSWRDWTVLFLFPVITIVSTYAKGIGGILPLVQKDFGVNDSETATLMTYASLAHGITLVFMWLFGDFLPRKPTFLCSLVVWMVMSAATVLAGQDQFWLFVLLRSLAAAALAVFRLLLTVIQADHFTDKMLSWALIGNILSESVIQFLLPPINAVFVTRDKGWRLPAIIPPVIMIPLSVIAAICIKAESAKEKPSTKAITRNSFGILKIPSYTLMIVSQMLSMFYSPAMGFWVPSMLVYSLQVYPEVFLGLPYTEIVTIGSNVALGGLLVGTLAVPLLKQIAESGLFCIRGTQLAIPLVYCFASLLETLCYLSEIITLPYSYPLVLTSMFFDSLTLVAINLTYQQLIFACIPTHQRASAFSLLKLMFVVGELPSAQIIGALSDHFRGASLEPEDRLRALQKAFYSTWFVALISAIIPFFILKFYKKDAEKAKLAGEENKEEATPLMSRRSTVASYTSMER